MKLDSADRKILGIAGSVLLITLLISVFLPSGEETSSPYPSAYSTASGGAKAAYTLLSQIGYQVEHWRRSPEKLLGYGANTVLLVAVPTQNPTPDDLKQIRDYVQKGGRLVAIGPTALSLLPHSEPIAGRPHFARQKYSALIPSGITRSALQITMTPAMYWSRTDSGSEIEYGDSEHGVVVSYPYGNGRVVWWAASDPLTNGGISEDSNLQLLINSIGSPTVETQYSASLQPPARRVVLWDDYFHGGEVTLTESLLASPLKWSLLQLGLLAVVVVVTYSRRHGPLRLLPQPSRLATLEFVETLGALYERVRATELPAQVAYERFRHLLHRKLGISATATPQQVTQRLAIRLGDLATECEQTLSRCESIRYQDDVPEEESMRLVKSLNQCSQQLKLTSFEGAK